MKNEKNFYCPLCGKAICEYDCEKLRCAVVTDCLATDGLSHLLSAEEINHGKEKCLSCERHLFCKRCHMCKKCLDREDCPARESCHMREKCSANNMS